MKSKKLPPENKNPKRGRPKSETAGDYGPLTIRLPNKIRYGLELLARAQHRSLSQAVEWALQVGLNSYEVGVQNMEPLGVVLDQAWAESSEASRLLRIYWSAPSLLSFEDFVACELADRSRERMEFLEEIPARELGLEPGKMTDKQSKQLMDRVKELEDLYSRFVIRLWPLIREKAIERANLGKPTQNVPLLHLLGLHVPGLSSPETMTAVLKKLDESTQ